MGYVSKAWQSFVPFIDCLTMIYVSLCCLIYLTSLIILFSFVLQIGKSLYFKLKIPHARGLPARFGKASELFLFAFFFFCFFFFFFVLFCFVFFVCLFVSFVVVVFCLFVCFSLFTQPPPPPLPQPLPEKNKQTNKNVSRKKCFLLVMFSCQ